MLQLVNLETAVKSDCVLTYIFFITSETVRANETKATKGKTKKKKKKQQQQLQKKQPKKRKKRKKTKANKTAAAATAKTEMFISLQETAKNPQLSIRDKQTHMCQNVIPPKTERHNTPLKLETLSHNISTETEGDADAQPDTETHNIPQETMTYNAT